jgi:hypothetical protein
MSAERVFYWVSVAMSALIYALGLWLVNQRVRGELDERFGPAVGRPLHLGLYFFGMGLYLAWGHRRLGQDRWLLAWCAGCLVFPFAAAWLR